MAGIAVEAFLLIGASILAGFLADALLRRARLSDVLVLLAVGVLIGPVLGLVDASWLAAAMPILAPLGLVIILFEGGLELKWADVQRHGTRGLVFALLSWGVTVAALHAAATLVLGIDPRHSILFAVAVAATGVVAVIPILGTLRASPKARVWLTLETGLGDVLSAVAVVALATLFLAGDVATWSAPLLFGQLMGTRVALGILVGVAGGLLWARALHFLEARSHAYAMTLGALLAAYAITEALGGSGYLAALVLGLVVGNAALVAGRGTFPPLGTLPERARGQQNEIIFLLRSVYFVYLGVILGPTLLTTSAATIALLTSALVAARIAVVLLSHRGDPREGALLAAVMPRGMAAMVLAGIPLAMGLPGAEVVVALSLVVVVGADVATTIGLLACGWLDRNARASHAAPGVVVPPR